MADSLWIIGVAMTKFGRYPDKDLHRPGQPRRRSARWPTPA